MKKQSLSLNNLNMINPEWLKYFVHFTNEGFNLTKTSANLYITPQALNQAIIGIEKTLNLKIIEKTDKIKKLTEAGEVVFNTSISILRNFQEMQSNLEDLKNEDPVGMVTIANCSISWSILVAEAFHKISLNYPKIFLKVQLFELQKIEELILKNQIDFALLPCRTKENKDIIMIEGPKFPFVIVRKLGVQTNNFIFPSHQYWEKTLEDYNIPYNIISLIDDHHTCMEIVKTGIAMTIVPENNFIKILIKNNVLEIVQRLDTKQQFECFIAYNRKLYMNNAKKIFLRTISKDID